MLLFVLSSLMSLSNLVTAICSPVLKSFPRLLQELSDARSNLFEELDDDAEKLLNLCTQAIVVKSLAILIHYQNRSDYLPKKTANMLNNHNNGSTNDNNSRKNNNSSKGAMSGTASRKFDEEFAISSPPPCTRACTLFCYYATRQFE
uniref:Uncharacterized protein n=1 Tax=Lygus hesperus TaxID=30085 RepID=A0A0A9VTT4_LYGHE